MILLPEQEVFSKAASCKVLIVSTRSRQYSTNIVFSPAVDKDEILCGRSDPRFAKQPWYGQPNSVPSAIAIFE
jgi:hypothetical protein